MRARPITRLVLLILGWNFYTEAPCDLNATLENVLLSSFNYDWNYYTEAPDEQNMIVGQSPAQLNQLCVTPCSALSRETGTDYHGYIGSRGFLQRPAADA